MFLLVSFRDIFNSCTFLAALGLFQYKLKSMPSALHSLLIALYLTYLSLTCFRHSIPSPTPSVSCNCLFTFNEQYMWQSCVEIEGYSVTYFDCIAAFKVPYHWTSVTGWASYALRRFIRYSYIYEALDCASTLYCMFISSATQASSCKVLTLLA